jgi:hypothetical protein
MHPRSLEELDEVEAELQELWKPILREKALFRRRYNLSAPINRALPIEILSTILLLSCAPYPRLHLSRAGRFSSPPEPSFSQVCSYWRTISLARLPMRASISLSSDVFWRSMHLDPGPPRKDIQPNSAIHVVRLSDRENMITSVFTDYLSMTAFDRLGDLEVSSDDSTMFRRLPITRNLHQLVALRMRHCFMDLGTQVLTNLQILSLSFGDDRDARLQWDELRDFLRHTPRLTELALNNAVDWIETDDDGHALPEDVIIMEALRKIHLSSPELMRLRELVTGFQSPVLSYITIAETRGPMLWEASLDDLLFAMYRLQEHSAAFEWTTEAAYVSLTRLAETAYDELSDADEYNMIRNYVVILRQYSSSQDRRNTLEVQAFLAIRTERDIREFFSALGSILDGENAHTLEFEWVERAQQVRWPSYEDWACLLREFPHLQTLHCQGTASAFTSFLEDDRALGSLPELVNLSAQDMDIVWLNHFMRHVRAAERSLDQVTLRSCSQHGRPTNQVVGFLKKIHEDTEFVVS